MIIIYWVYRNHKKHHRTYRFVRAAAFMGGALSLGL